MSRFNIFVRHKIEKSNVILDVLSRLQVNVDVLADEKLDVLKSLFEHSLELLNYDLSTIEATIIVAHHVTLMKLSNNFKQRLKQVYQNNEHWKKILIIVTQCELVSEIS